ncbi:MAG TPA: di-heme-cytochrome C peroxidase [Isosphaeraceae bacterium]|jgi:hypothetical protein|nr:di-heme-cytochrome C peroxidase [Isosphaeraceae bacterium]
MGKRWRVLLAAITAIVAAAAVVVYVVFDIYEVGGVRMPRFDRVDEARHVVRLSAKQGWPDGWRPGQAHWFHHASQGTRILPRDWFLNLEQPSLSPYHAPRRIVEDGYLRRFGFLPSEADGRLNPGGELPLGFAIEDDFDAPYANPPSSGPVIGLTCAACHTGEVRFRDDTGALKAVRVEGGSAMINLVAFQRAIGMALYYTDAFDTRFERFARGVLKDRYNTPGERERLRDQLRQFIQTGLTSQNYLKQHKLDGTEGGFGRTDALGLIGNRVFVALGNENLIVADAPVNFPPLWDTAWFDWVQYNASIRMPMVRNIGEALGVGAPVNVVEGRGKLFASTVDVKELHAMEDQLGGHEPFAGLRPPRWADTGLPAPDPVRAARGATLYRQQCRRCHLPPMAEIEADARLDPPKLDIWEMDKQSKKRFLKLVLCDLQEVGTDQNQALNFYRRVAVFNGRTTSAALGLFVVTEMIREDKYAALELDSKQINAYDRFRSFDQGTRADVLAGKSIEEVLVANLGYKARPLDGVWATPPYLHNGSVPNLYELLVPVERRSKSFHLGTTLYDPVRVGYRTEGVPDDFTLDTNLTGNHNVGHEFRNLSLEELESVPETIPGGSAATGTAASRWARVLGLTEPEYLRLDDPGRRAMARAATRAALEVGRVERERPFKGVLGAEFTEEERLDLIEYLKTL